MTVFQVWAPAARMVDLVIEGRKIGMEHRATGWWFVEASEVGPAADYAFSVDAGELALPDPRSQWQPNGVHGPSRVYDQSAFQWTDQHWQAPPLASAVIYELHVGTFSEEGTFNGVIDHLDHLVEMGITHVELMPVAEFSGERGWGYDGVNLFAPHHVYGGPEGLKRLVNACHEKGLAVLLDVVYNHLGPEGNYLGLFGPYFTDRYQTPWGQAINLDGPDSEEVRRFFIDNALHWLKNYHFDGLRLDAVHAIIDTSAIHILEQLAYEVDQLEAQLGRHLVLIAESDLNDPKIIYHPAMGGYGLDAQWSDDFHHALHTVLTGEKEGYYEDFGSLADLAKAFIQAYVFDNRYSPHRRRRHGRAPVDAPGYRFLAYIQNHDQIGNRARGERLNQLVDLPLVKTAAALVFGSPFIPMLFQGEEWAASTPFQYFTSHEDPALGAAVSKGRREEFASFGWDPEDVPDPQSKETFLASKLKWDELSRPPHAEILDWYKKLISLRKEQPDLSTMDFDQVEIDFDSDEGWMMIWRGAVLLACNLIVNEDQLLEIEKGEILLSSNPGAHLEGDGLLLPPGSAVFLKVS